MAHMVNHRVADAEVTRKIEEQKASAWKLSKHTAERLEGESLWAMQQHYPELFDNIEEVKETVKETVL